MTGVRHYRRRGPAWLAGADGGRRASVKVADTGMQRDVVGFEVVADAGKQGPKSKAAQREGGQSDEAIDHGVFQLSTGPLGVERRLTFPAPLVFERTPTATSCSAESAPTATTLAAATRPSHP